ncbi:MAG TPA: hypothetical protein ENG19_01290 [Candidatus Bathyarchaeota archaeon]|nr:hypothetical protein [Candidatus Bathyarchaeota archaeon]
MKMQMLRLPLESQPPNNEATTPAAKLGGEKERLKSSARIPPEKEESNPRYGPTIMPIKGARIVAAVMCFPTKPIICDIGMNDKITYRAVKQAVKAIFLVVSFPLIVIYSILRVF